MSYREVFVTDIIMCRDCRMLFEDFIPTIYKDKGTVDINYRNLSAIDSLECGFFYGTIKSLLPFGVEEILSEIKNILQGLDFCSQVKFITKYGVLSSKEVD